MKLIWSEQAIKNLQTIFEYIAADSEEKAARVINVLVQCPESLLDFPHMGATVPELPLSGLRELLKYSYRIVYAINDEQIQIVAVIHDRQSFKKAFYHK